MGFRDPMWLALWGLGGLCSLVQLALWDLKASWGLGPLAAGPGDFEVLWGWAPCSWPWWCGVQLVQVVAEGQSKEHVLIPAPLQQL